MRQRIFLCLWLAVSAVVAACGPNTYNEVELMPAPTAFISGHLDPFGSVTDDNIEHHEKLFYATDRKPAHEGDPQDFYNNERGFVLRTGVANVVADPPFETWENARRITLVEQRDQPYKLRVVGAQEIGIMPFSMTRYMENPPTSAQTAAAGRRFAAQINAQLAGTSNKDVFIYTHGYNVDFDYATLVSKQLQHYLGYQGAFISYNWTATPSRLAYFRDQESALATRRNLRELITFLSINTQARRIHLIGYSAGTRLAFDTAYQIALSAAPSEKLGKVILIGSDLDRAYFIQAIEDGLLDVVTDLTIYQSLTDSALAISRFVFGRRRVGETAESGGIVPAVQTQLATIDGLHVIDVTDAEAANTGNGHWYFQSSPWASSDLFLSLLTDKGPPERGLVRAPDNIAWSFPADYPERLGRMNLSN